jgi:hypothetical protein
VLEDYAVLQAALQTVRREAREQHELNTFLLKAVAADLAAHRADAGAHPAGREPAVRRAGTRPARFTA